MSKSKAFKRLVGTTMAKDAGNSKGLSHLYILIWIFTMLTTMLEYWAVIKKKVIYQKMALLDTSMQRVYFSGNRRK
ncbi:hypothetical protein [Geosporobacter ferrireducens]|uniref:Uncharacterized protein n=1 Tax=Geosporobacter ferrireducens TaxID=1424294 RepID=A0A1D8GDJ9_9FIRM|nr:hypothetical protein [Geosporobacter ferrireducens]AOT68988.1 hypothetical protein Gferi_05105 [Geosporobacter ferrireducens]MTI58344.1 hypothetical protein [Geosporobacter ferrireducens]